MKVETESKIQQDCYVWFTNNYCLEKHENRSIMFSVPNESNGSQQRKVNTGLLRGVSDTIIVLPSKVLFVEFKTEKGYQSEFQKDFQERVTKLGHEYYVIRNLDQFKQLIYAEIPTTNLHN
jgi:hypothetical protein